jgi:hypothetical protein
LLYSYFNHLDRITSQDYIPTAEDILRSKMRTTGVLETVFETSGIEFTIVDVGGQRSERRKWLHIFENITAVIYLAALDACMLTWFTRFTLFICVLFCFVLFLRFDDLNLFYSILLSFLN